MNHVALCLLFIFSLPVLFIIGKLIQRLFFKVPPLPKGCFLVRVGSKWAFRHGTYLSQFSYRSKRKAALHAIGYVKNLSRL